MALLSNGISNPRVTAHPASTMDIFSTLVDVCGLDATFPIEPGVGVALDGSATGGAHIVEHESTCEMGRG